MPKAKGKKKITRKSAPKKSAAPAAAASRELPARIFVGASVKVKAGVHGNATGTVAGLSGSGVLVRLSNAPGDPLPFDSENLLAA